MKTKIIFLIVICLSAIKCRDKQETIDQYLNYIDIDFNDLDHQKNLQLFMEASKRFDEYVYKDENNILKTSINKGADIKISENIFNILSQSLKYREQIEILKYKRLNMKTNNDEEKLLLTRSFPVGNYEQWVYGQLNYLWNEIIGTWQEINDAMITFFCVAIGASIATIIDYLAMPFSGPGFIIPPTDRPNPNILPLAEGESFHTNLPDGLYPSPLSDHLYIAVRNGFATVKSCSYAFSWYRGKIYYNVEDRDLIDINHAS